MVKIRRITGEERRDSILKAALGVFAENGFRGTTTRALAEAAGVSEALLFQHFPNKEALYEAVQSAFFREQESETRSDWLALEPSSAALVWIVHGFYINLIDPVGKEVKLDRAILARLMFRSLVEDGEFARLFIRRIPAQLVKKIEDCIQAAAAANDLDTSPRHLNLAGWFTHHLAITLMLHQLTKVSVVDYGVPRARLVEEAVRFALRGIGLKEEAIRRHYRPDKMPRAKT
jgi:AcrR family transcriptional regulator